MRWGSDGLAVFTADELPAAVREDIESKRYRRRGVGTRICGCYCHEQNWHVCVEHRRMAEAQ